MRPSLSEESAPARRKASIAESMPAPSGPVVGTKDFFTTVVHQSTDMISIHDLEGVYTYASPASVALLGYEPEDLVGRSAYDFFHPDDLKSIQGSHEAVLDQADVQTVSYRIRTKDGSYTWFETTSKTIRDPMTREPRQIMAVSRDVSQRMEMKQELEGAIREIQGEQSLRTQLLHNIAHDLASALSPVKINMYILKKFEADPGSVPPGLLDQLLRQSDFVFRLVDDLRDVVRIQTGKLRFSLEDVALQRLVREALEHQRVEFEAKDLRLEINVPEDLVVQADPHRVRQVLLNLLSNARKYTPSGGRIAVRAWKEAAESRAGVAIHDTGIGLEADDVNRLFQPFVQVHDPAGFAERGTGLGLYICKAVVEKLGGTISAESPGPGQGTRVTFTLPLGSKG